jgi:hypothetical protein
VFVLVFFLFGQGLRLVGAGRPVVERITTFHGVQAAAKVFSQNSFNGGGAGAACRSGLKKPAFCTFPKLFFMQGS